MRIMVGLTPANNIYAVSAFMEWAKSKKPCSIFGRRRYVLPFHAFTSLPVLSG